MAEKVDLTLFRMMLEKVQTLADLKQVDTLLRLRWKELQAAACSDAVKNGILPGAQVEFSAKGRKFSGMVVKINSKSVSVDTGSGVWKVTPTLLKLVA